MKILILDDHSLFSEGLGKILADHSSNFDISIYKSIKELAVNKVIFSDYELIISDIELPGEDIFLFLSGLKRSFRHIPVLIISMHNKLSVIKKCKELEIEGYILKDDYDLIIPVVEKLLDGKSFYSEKVEQKLQILNKQEDILTPKEEEIIALLSKGKNNQEIAEQLFISYHTIKTHRKNINRKLNLSTTGELIKYYFDNYI